MSDASPLGPLDFVLIEFPDRAPTGSVAAALSTILDQGVVRLFDIAVIRRDERAVTRVDLVGGIPGLDALAAFAGAESGLFAPSDVEEAGAALEPGTYGLMLAFENTWARGFVAAAHEAGGRMIASERIPAQVLLDVLDEIEAAEAAT